jgi:hypothetical protein
MAAERALIDLFREILQPLRVHLVPHKKEFPEPGFADGPVFRGLQGTEGRDPLIVGHCEDWTLLDAFAAARAAIHFDPLFEGEF